ncbi:MAG TPA: hypothetical protein VGI60_13315 [Chthoniobacterales bacterium]
MTNGTGPIGNHVWLVKGIGPLILSGVTGLAVLVDRFKGDAALNAIPESVLQFDGRQSVIPQKGIVMATGAVVDEVGVAAGKFPGVKEAFIAPPLKGNDDGKTQRDGEETSQKARQRPGLDSLIKIEVTLILL